MSIANWITEYYPTGAWESKFETEIDAAKHCLNKWEGLREDALKKHRITIQGKIIGDGDCLFFIDSSTCALCAFNNDNCEKCAIYLATGTDCSGDLSDPDFDADDADKEFPYIQFLTSLDPEPMIDTLITTIEYLEKEENSHVL